MAIELDHLSPRAIGATLLGTGALAVAAMAHHPALHGASAQAVVDSAGQVAGMSAAVHGSLLILALIQSYLFSEVGRFPTLRGPLQRAGVGLWMGGTAALIGAVLISGFITPDIGLLVGPHGIAPANGQVQMRIAYVVNQRLSQLGTLLWCAGIAMMSLRMIRLPRAYRFLGVLGIVLALVTSIGLVSGHLVLDRGGMSLVVAGVAIWLGLLGATLLSPQSATGSCSQE
jgi:hypothetical protein